MKKNLVILPALLIGALLATQSLASALHPEFELSEIKELPEEEETKEEPATSEEEETKEEPAAEEEVTEEAKAQEVEPEAQEEEVAEEEVAEEETKEEIAEEMPAEEETSEETKEPEKEAPEKVGEPEKDPFELAPILLPPEPSNADEPYLVTIDHPATGETILTGLYTDELEAPQEGAPFPKSLFVHTNEGYGWELPLLWTDEGGAFVEKPEPGIPYLPVIAFAIPEGAMVEEGTILSLPAPFADFYPEGMKCYYEEENGITFIAGENFSLGWLPFQLPQPRFTEDPLSPALQ